MAGDCNLPSLLSRQVRPVCCVGTLPKSKRKMLPFCLEMLENVILIAVMVATKMLRGSVEPSCKFPKTAGQMLGDCAIEQEQGKRVRPLFPDAPSRGADLALR
jgi:hypothetical protein